MGIPLDVNARLAIAPVVAEALRVGHPVVALESTLISHGLPYPQNLQVATEAEAAIRAAGAVPATVAIHDGRLLVGLDPAALETLATAPAGSVRKAARPSLAAAIAGGGWAATTVSATMIAAHAAGITVFATGGIGGVHRGALGGTAASGMAASGTTAGGATAGVAATRGEAARGAATRGEAARGVPSFDISSDLEELARTPMAVVCAGPKMILDVAATLEYLETRGVPVAAIGQTELPGFIARSSGIPAPNSVPDVAAAAELVRIHLGLGLGGGLLLCVPVPEDDAVPEPAAVESVERAVEAAAREGVTGPALTPWLLARIGALTEGASIRANTALIVNNARVAGELATRLTTR